MANKDDKTTEKTTARTKKVQPETTGTPVQSGTVETTTIQEGETGKPERSEKELSFSTEQVDSEQKNGKGNTGLDSENKEKTVIQKGGESVNQVDNKQFSNDANIEIVIVPEKKIIEETVDELPETIAIKRKRIAIDVFSKHPQCKELYFTTDLVPFFVKSDAIRHGAGTLKNDTIVTVYRK